MRTRSKASVEYEYPDFLLALGLTCQIEGFKGAILTAIYRDIAENKLSNCVGVIFAVNAGILDAKNVRQALMQPSEAINTEGIIIELRDRLIGFESFHSFLQERDQKLGFVIDSAVDIADRVGGEKPDISQLDFISVKARRGDGGPPN